MAKLVTLYCGDYAAALVRIAGPIAEILGEDAKVTLTDVREYHEKGLCTCEGCDAYMHIETLGTVYLMNSTSRDLKNHNTAYLCKQLVLSDEKRSTLETAINTWLQRLAAEKRVNLFKAELLGQVFRDSIVE